jgi:hypothetical protein
MSSGGYFSILEKNPNFGEIKQTCRLPITKFASTLCLKPTYTSQGNITAVFLYDNKNVSYQLEFLLWCVEDWGYFFFDDPMIKEARYCGLSCGNISSLDKYPEIYLKPLGPADYISIPM